MSRAVPVPVQLGCCPDAPRCVLCAPSAEPPAPETVAALCESYERDRVRDGDDVFVAFYGGPPPADALIEPIGDRPFRVRVRPDLLTRADAARLVARGCRGIELDALTFDDGVLKAAGRRYTGARLREMVGGLRAHGVDVGLVLAPGLPGSTHDDALRDAAAAAEVADTVRLHPVLVLARSRLEERHRAGFYRPMPLGAAVTVCRAMMDVLEARGVRVIRVGLQPGPDGYGRAVAGPLHPSLRELVESRRSLDRLRGLLDGLPPGAHIEIRCAPPDETRTRGPCNQHVRTLRAEFALQELRVVPDPALRRGEWQVQVLRETG